MQTVSGYGGRQMAAFRSKFEQQIADYLTKRNIPFEYEGCKLSYTVPETKRNYIVDWQIGDNKNIIFESKGRLTSADRKKMLLVRDNNPEIVIRFIFMNSDVKIRKGSKTSYADWCRKNNFEFCDFRKGIPKQWLKNG